MASIIPCYTECRETARRFPSGFQHDVQSGYCSRIPYMQKTKNKGGLPSKQAQVRATPVAAPSKMAGKIKQDAVFTQREYVGLLSGNSANFLLLGSSGVFPGYDVNPGNGILFPWLSRVAANYEKYRFEKLEFEIVPRNPSTVSGAVYAAVDYDWDDNVATSVQQLMSNHGAVSSDVWRQFTLTVDVAKMNQDVPYRYVESVARTVNSQRMMYGGFLMVAIAGSATLLTFDLFVRYTVRFTLPALHATLSEGTQTLGNITTIAPATITPLAALPKVDGLEQVTSASVGVPAFGTFTGAPGWRVPASNRGMIEAIFVAATTGQPPSNYVTDSLFDMGVYDAGGTKLADVSSVGGQNRLQAPDNPALWSSNGATGRSLVAFSFAQLRALYPLAAYLMPYFYSANGRVLNTNSGLIVKHSEL